ncbi:lipopolysaccharide biosynthesis protein [Thiohalorhabdus methylotrophus]|uniref:Lipopolysaccharide biosynthesis protein n=1 Tax=Thiohalorhabdus methylotrophus TaxID=3242694 RepID=A0ABV4TUF7_9GAMM
MTYLGGKIASGAAWMVSMRLVVRSIGLLSTIIVARLLSPADFGLVALATSIYALVEFLGAFGFGEAIIQRHDTDRSHYDTAWTLNLAFGVLAATAMALMAGPVAGFFDEPRLELIIYVLALTAFIDQAHNIGVEALRKELEMQKIFQLQVVEKVVAFFTTVTLAYLYESYWALVAGMAIGTVAFSVTSFLITPFRPRFSLARFQELFVFSRWLFLTNILSYGDRKSGSIIIGKLAGASSIGIFSVSQNIAHIPAVELVKPLNQALFPGYSKVKNEPGTLRRYYLKSLSLVSLVVFPTATGLAITAPGLIPLLLGEQWEQAIPVMQVLAVAGIAQALAIVNMSIHLAINQPHLTTVFNGVKVLLLIPSMIYAVFHWGAIGAAWAYLCVNLLLAPTRIWVVKRSLALRGRGIAEALWRPITATLVMAAAVYGMGLYLGDAPVAVRLPGQITAGVVVFSAMVLGLWRLAGRPEGGEEFVMHQLRGLLPGRVRFG